MKSQHIKWFAASLVSFSLIAITALPAFAQTGPIPQPADSGYGLSGTNFSNVGLATNDDVEGTAASMINIVLGLLGIIAVIIIIYAGFKWMTAGGNEEQVGDAKKMLIQSIIGLAVIFSAWIIASFVIDRLGRATGA